MADVRIAATARFALRPTIGIVACMSSQPTTDNAPWTINRLLNWTADYFTQHGVDEPRLSAEVLLAHAAGCRRIDIYARFEKTIDADATARFRDLVKRAAKHEPIAYLVGEREFYSLAFAVSSAVLIPRPETETLVEWAVDTLRAQSGGRPGGTTPDAKTEAKPDAADIALEAAEALEPENGAAADDEPSDEGRPAALLDVGTGSGCIAISILHQLKRTRAVASDCSADALEVAAQNAEKHGVEDRISWCHALTLDLPADCKPDGGFDLIVSNPPYISATEWAELPQNVRDYEPGAALTDEADGLTVYRGLAAGARAWLAADGLVAVEVAANRDEAVRGVFADAGATCQQALQDRTTGHVRVLAFAYGD